MICTIKRSFICFKDNLAKKVGLVTQFIFQ